MKLTSVWSKCGPFYELYISELDVTLELIGYDRECVRRHDNCRIMEPTLSWEHT